MAQKILTYVSSEGLDPMTGELYPDPEPKERSVSTVYLLLKQGFTVMKVDGGCHQPLSAYELQLQYKDELCISAKDISKGDNRVPDNKRK